MPASGGLGRSEDESFHHGVHQADLLGEAYAEHHRQHESQRGEADEVLGQVDEHVLDAFGRQEALYRDHRIL
jgi:hypothetical protein